MLVKKLIVLILAILLIACLVVFPYIYVVDNTVLKSDFLNETVNKAGIYDSAYDLFAKKGEKEVVGFFVDKDLGEGIGNWIWGNIDQVLDEPFVKDLAKQNVESSIGYVLGESDTLSEFDLTNKYDALKVVTAENLTMDIVLGVIPEQQAALLKFLGILREGGEIHPQIKTLMIDLVFESNKQIKEYFDISTTQELMTVAGIDGFQDTLDGYRAKLEDIRRYRDYPFLLGIILSAIMFVLGLKYLRRSFKNLSITYFIGALITVCSGAIVVSSEKIAAKYAMQLVSDFGLAINQQAIFDVVKVVGKQAVTFGLYYLAISACLFVIAQIFKKKKKDDQSEEIKKIAEQAV
jgi:hypothetical protein